jgi:hypothetical protein
MRKRERLKRKRKKEMIFIVIAILLFSIILFTLSCYSREGDVQSSFSSREEEEGDGEEEKDEKEDGKEKDEKDGKKKMITELYKLALYKTAKVRWNIYLGIAMSISVIVLHLLGTFTFKNLIMTTPFIFAGLYVPYIHESTHVNSKLSNDASMLYARLIS